MTDLANQTPGVYLQPDAPVPPVAPVSQSQAMGINPSAGPTSAAAAIAVDSGATEVVQRQQAEQQAAELAKKQDKYQNSGRDSSGCSEVVSATGCSCLRSNAGVWC